MLQVLLDFVFNIVTHLSRAFITPITTNLFLLFPDLQSMLVNVLTFFNMALPYVTCVYRWLLFTPTMFVALFDFFAIRFIIFIFTSGIRFTVKLWNVLKL